MSKTNQKTHFSGQLIVVEGIDGAGKTTLIEKLVKKLEGIGQRVTTSEWRESQYIGPYLKELAARSAKIVPRAFSAVHAADFADRLYRDILPALERGEVVICDRYYYTELVRDAGLGIEATWSADLFPFAPEPDLILHVDVSLATSIARIRKRVKKSGKAGSLNKSLRTALLGSLLGSLDSTTGMIIDARWKEDGEPMTETDREQIKFGFQVRTRDTYNNLFRDKANVVTLDGEQDKKAVAKLGWDAVKEVVINEKNF
jgi:dTMP kinase